MSELERIVEWSRKEGVTPEFRVDVDTRTTGEHLSADERGLRYSGSHTYLVRAFRPRPVHDREIGRFTVATVEERPALELRQGDRIYHYPRPLHLVKKVVHRGDFADVYTFHTTNLRIPQREQPLVVPADFKILVIGGIP